jgi:hypothetical protein
MFGRIMVGSRKGGKDVKESIHLLGDIIPAFTCKDSINCTTPVGIAPVFRFQQRSIEDVAVVISTQPQSLPYDAYVPLNTSAVTAVIRKPTLSEAASQYLPLVC